MFGSLGVPEILFLFVLALLVFGPKKLPEVGRALGRGLSELRKATTEIRRTINTELIDDEIRQANPRRLVQDSLRDVRRDLDQAVRGETSTPRPARLAPPAETATEDLVIEAPSPEDVPAPEAVPSTVDETPVNAASPATVARGSMAAGEASEPHESSATDSTSSDPAADDPAADDAAANETR